MKVLPGTTQQEQVEIQSVQWRALAVPFLLTTLSWVIILGADAFHQLYWIDHDYLLTRSHLSWIAAFGIFLLSWQVMTLAMMLPSTLLTIALLGEDCLESTGRTSRQLMFLTTYIFVWTCFAVLIFVGDSFIHWLVAQWWWLSSYAWLIGCSLLLTAAAFQFSRLKRRCLAFCSSAYLSSPPASSRQPASFWILGLEYGSFCLGSCWALMLVMVGLGMKSVLAMSLGSAVILLEKSIPGGQRTRPIIGIVYVVLAVAWSFSAGRFI